MALRSYLRHVLVATGLTLVVGACVDTPAGSLPDAAAPGDAALGRTATTSEETLLAPATLEPIARYLKTPHAQDYWIKQWVGPGGGTVDFQGFKIIVPAGAVDRVTMFQIRIPGANDPNGQDHAYAEFGPHNVQFRVPVTIELPYRNTDAYGFSSGVMWYDERAKQWVSMGGGITADGERVQLRTSHFSTYGTAAPGGGTLSSGG